MWNSVSLVPPPNNTCKIKSHSLDLNALQKVSQEATDILRVMKKLETECLLLSRCIYKLKLQFRCDKGFKLMMMTNKSLRKFLRLKLDKVVTEFLNTLPRKFEKNSYFPSRQMLDFLLIRMQGSAKILCRIVEIAMKTALYMNYRLSLGHFHVVAAFVLCVVSRIWQICKSFTKYICSWYNSLLPLRKTLEVCGVQWLPAEYAFPPDLIEWLDMDWINDSPFLVSKMEIELPVLSLLEDLGDESDDEVKFCASYKLNDFFVVDDSDDEIESKKVAHTNDEGVINIPDESVISINSTCDFDDEGESVPRDAFDSCSAEVMCLDSDAGNAFKTPKRKRKALRTSNATNILKQTIKKKKKPPKRSFSGDSSDVEIISEEENVSGVGTTPKRKLSITSIDDSPKKLKRGPKQKGKNTGTFSLNKSVITLSDDNSSPTARSTQSFINKSNGSSTSKKKKKKKKNKNKNQSSKIFKK